ncbi:hypothetical protein GCM10027589_04100 [Actinocorallia lasiicapitis]
MLRGEGLILTEHGLGTFKRSQMPVTVIALYPGDSVRARAATQEEQRRLDVPPGVPVVERAGGDREIYPGDRTMITRPG